MKLFVKNLTNVDFSYLHTDRGLMGESWLAQLELEGELNTQGMICDFGIVKRNVRDWLDTYVDHRLVVPCTSQRTQITHSGDNLALKWRYPSGEVLICDAPEEAFCQVDRAEITAESLAHWCEAQLLALFGDEVQGLKIRFVPESIEGAYYHYSHGLQQHDGNCQRIAHGHRSIVEVYLDGQRSETVEAQWAQRWKDIYLGTTAHRVEGDAGYNKYCYSAPQGAFSLMLPTAYCDDLETETTVEYIAQHLAVKVKAEYPHSAVEVRAYEGIGKGAVASA
ncbi:MAG: 6-carboxytetrahydropterin synthase [Pseudomonadales bacterium]